MKNLNAKPIYRRPSTWIGIVVIFCWAATMVLLLRDYRGFGDIPTMDPDSADFFDSVEIHEKWKDIEEWMVIVQVNPETDSTRTVGASRTSIVRMDNPTSTSAYRGEFVISAKLSPLLPRGTIEGTADLDRDGNLTTFGVRGELGGLRLQSQGAVINEVLYVLLDNLNDTSRMKKRLGGSVTFGEMLRPSLARHMKLEPGARMSSPIIDPLTGQSRGLIRLDVIGREQINLQGRLRSALRVRSSVGDVQTYMWVDDEGRTLRRNLVNNLRMDRIDREAAIKIAPELEREIEFPPLDMTAFRAVPMDDVSDDATDASGQAGMLNFFLR